MKWLLNFFPRPWLIQLSLFFRPFIKLYFSGNTFEDPIDGSRYRTFLPYGYQNLRKNALCPGTLSLERHRLLWLYLERKTSFLTQPLKVLHVAPEQVFYQVFKQYSHWDYTTTDLHSPWPWSKPIFVPYPLKTTAMTLFCVTMYWNTSPTTPKRCENFFVC